jgi:hypothetical protein
MAALLLSFTVCFARGRAAVRIGEKHRRYSCRNSSAGDSASLRSSVDAAGTGARHVGKRALRPGRRPAGDAGVAFVPVGGSAHHHHRWSGAISIHRMEDSG